MRRGLVAVAIALAVAMASTACGDARAGTGVVDLGAIYPISGRQGVSGVEEARGARLAVDLANERGGIQGRPIKLHLLNVSIGDAAPYALAKLRRQGIRVALGSYGSVISAPASVAAHRTGMLLWETGAVGEIAPDAGAGTSFFRLPPAGAHLGSAGVAFVRDQLAPLLHPDHPLRYAVAYIDDVYGRAVGRGAADEITRTGQQLAGVFPYQALTFNAPQVVSRIAAVHPDVLFVSAYLEDGVALRKATIDQHLPLLASIGTSSSYCMREFAAALGPAAVGLLASDKPNGPALPDAPLTPDAQRALHWARDTYNRRYHDILTAPALAGFANAWALVGHVLPAAKAATPAAVAAAALSVKLPTGALPNGAGLDLAGPRAPDAGENRGAVSVIWQWVAERKQAIVWPPALATEPLRAIPIQT